MNNVKKEAIAQADAYLNNVGLPTYTELRKALERLNSSVNGEALGTTKVPAWHIACEADAIARAAKGL